MYPYYTGYKPNIALHQDDINGIRYLYGLSTKPLSALVQISLQRLRIQIFILIFIIIAVNLNVFLSTVLPQLLVDMHINYLNLDVPVVCGKKFFTERVINLWNHSATNCQCHISVFVSTNNM